MWWNYFIGTISVAIVIAGIALMLGEIKSWPPIDGDGPDGYA